MDTTTRSIALEPLSQSNLVLEDKSEDITGRTVFDRNGDEVGSVKDLLIDSQERKVRFMRLSAGGFMGIGEQTYLIPIDAITGIDERGVHVDQTRERVTGGPRYEPDLVGDMSHYSDVYGYYGYTPFWASGYAYPAYPHYRR